MKSNAIIVGKAYVLGDNIDTDQIIPAQYLTLNPSIPDEYRQFGLGKHKSVDDTPYGGGPGMVMTPEPLVPAIEALAGAKGPGRGVHVICQKPLAPTFEEARDIVAGATKAG